MPARRPAALSWVPVQLVVLFVTLAALDLACQLAGGRLVHAVPVPARDLARLASAVGLSAAMIAAYRALVRLIEQRTPDELAAAGAVRGLIMGAASGALLFVLVYAVLWMLGTVSALRLGTASGLGAALAVATASAVGEEVVFRGVVFRLLESRLGTTSAISLSAVVFGLVHAGNPGATWVSTAAIALESGVLLGVAYAATRTLWLPIGLHFGWNLTEGGIFGAAVSGGQTAGLLAAPLTGPAWITGGAFGPEASVAAVAVSVCASVALIWVTARGGAWRPARLRRAVRPPEE
jgi:membrane protease YdiL (CAAX protease family)